MMPVRRGLSLIALVAIVLVPASAAAQAVTPPGGVAAVTFAWQWIDNTGHIVTDGSMSPLKRDSVSTGALIEVDYGVTDRLAATVSVPYVFARFTGSKEDARFSTESCLCWQESLQDFSIAGRYRLGDQFWGLTPQVRVIVPSRDYPYQGEAVVGPNLNQVLLGLNGVWRFAPKMNIQAAYTFALVEKVEDLRPNRSNLSMTFGYNLSRALYVHAGGLLQKTHDGFTGKYLFSADATAEQRAQGDRLLKTRYAHLTGGVSYTFDFVDLFFSVEPYVWGRDAHDGIAYNLGATWYFKFPK